MKKKLYIATLVFVMVLGVFVTASNAVELTDENVTTETTIEENVNDETTIEEDVNDDSVIEEDDVDYDTEDTISEDEEFTEIYLGEDEIYVYTAVCDRESNDWFLYESCKHCDLAACTDTTPEEIYDRFGINVE